MKKEYKNKISVNKTYYNRIKISPQKDNFKSILIIKNQFYNLDNNKSSSNNKMSH